MGTPGFMLKPLIKQHNIIVFSSNYTLYQDISTRVMATLATFVPRMEIYSIDEAFLDMSELAHEDLLALSIKIMRTIKQHVGMPVSIGIAQTKTLAKMANRFAKKKRKDLGIHCLANQGLITEALEFTEVGEIWGIGKQYQKLLVGNGFKTAADLIQANDQWIKKNLSVVGERMVNELRGIPSIEWQFKPVTRKKVCTSRSFGTLMTEAKHIKQAISNYTASCAEKLRQEHTCARKIHVYLETNIHRTQDAQYNRSMTMQLPIASNSTAELIKYACRCFEMIFKSGYNYKKAGVIVIDLVPETEVQYSIFDQQDAEKARRLSTMSLS